MDVTVLKNAVQKQLANTSGLHSLQLQNHIYGCFLVMEDIAQKVVELSDDKLVGPSYSFNINQQFSDIGLRYGFVMDTKLALLDHHPEYKEAWLQTFHDLSMLQDIEYADAVEDCLIDIIQQLIVLDDSYFMHALDTGSLPQEWIGKVLALIHSSDNKVVVNEPNEEEEIKKSGLSQACTEKPIKHKRLSSTHRRIVPNTVVHKHLAKTRKHT